MKLISEQNFNDVHCVIEEATEDSPKKLYIEGIFMQTETKNRNGRIYPRTIMEPVIDKYINEQVKPGRAIGEFMHPSSGQINLDRVSHRITELNWKGNDIYGKALVLNTPCGNITKGLLEGGVNIGVSSRGMGSLKKNSDGVNIVESDFNLVTIDVVNDPSAPAAWVNGILEGVEYLYDSNGNLIEQEAEKLQKEHYSRMQKIIRCSHIKRDLVEHQIRSFNKFMNSIT